MRRNLFIVISTERQRVEKSSHKDRHSRPDKRPQRIHHQIRQFEKAYAKEQLEALDAEGEAEAGQGRKPEPTPGAEPLGRCQELREEEAERDEGGDVRNHLCEPDLAALDEPMILRHKTNALHMDLTVKPSNQYRCIQQEHDG